MLLPFECEVTLDDITKTPLRIATALSVLDFYFLKSPESIATCDYLLLYWPQIFQSFESIGGRV